MPSQILMADLQFINRTSLFQITMFKKHLVTCKPPVYSRHDDLWKYTRWEGKGPSTRCFISSITKNKLMWALARVSLWQGGETPDNGVRKNSSLVFQIGTTDSDKTIFTYDGKLQCISYIFIWSSVQ